MTEKLEHNGKLYELLVNAGSTEPGCHTCHLCRLNPEMPLGHECLVPSDMRCLNQSFSHWREVESGMTPGPTDERWLEVQ